MDERVQSLLEEAYLREAERAVRCTIYARVAEEEGRARLAELLRSTGRSATEHSRALLTYMGEVEASEQNLHHLSHEDIEPGEGVFRELARAAGEAWDHASSVDEANPSRGANWGGALAEYCERILDAKARGRAEMESVLETVGPAR